MNINEAQPRACHSNNEQLGKKLITDKRISGLDERNKKMITYRDVDGDSGVLAYDLGPDYIDVQFKNTSRKYRYSYQKAGRANVETMKELAKNGNGLNSFINKNVKYLYD